MLTVLVILCIWLLLNVLFVLIVVPPRKSRSPLATSGPTFAPAPIDKHQDQIDRDQPFSLRDAFVALATGVFFVFAPPLIAIRDAVLRLWKRTRT